MPYKYDINEQFFERWFPEMAYVLGWIYSDGTLRGNRYQFKIATNDQEVLENIKEMMGSNHRIAKRKDPRRKKITFELVIDSKRIYGSLVRLGVTPNKNKDMRLPKIPRKYLPYFLRGYFEGDGTVYIDTPGVYKGKAYKRVYCRFCSASRQFLADLQKTFTQQLGLRPKKLRKNHSAFDIGYSTKEALVLLRYLYKDKLNMRLERKYKRLIKYESLFRANQYWAKKKGVK